jgi:aspartate carbamoyltransferase catalytic subunit
MGALQIKHLFGLQGVSKSDIRTILDNAKQFREILERPVKRCPRSVALRW